MGDFIAVGADDHGVEVPVVVDLMAEGAQGELAAAAQGVEDGAFGMDGVLGCGAVQGADCGVDGYVGGVLRTSYLQGEGSLAGGWGEFVDGEALVDRLGAAEAVQAGGGEDEGVGLAFGPLAEAGVDVAAHLDEADVGAESKDHGLAARRSGRDAGAGGEHVEAPVVFADEGVASVGAWGDGGEGEAGGDLRGQVFEGVDGEVDAVGEEGVFDLLDEDAGTVGGKAFGWSEVRVLHAVADGADDLDCDGVAEGAELRGDVVGLPERELGAARADADRVCHLC